jgi:hypothetical protein
MQHPKRRNRQQLRPPLAPQNKHAPRSVPRKLPPQRRGQR